MRTSHRAGALRCGPTSAMDVDDDPRCMYSVSTNEEDVVSRDIVEQRATRQSRINLRASARQEQLLKQAAAATDRTMTDFVLESAVVEAERVLADRRWFLISDEQWDEFQRLLEQPARDLPRLRALLAKPSPFADEE